MSISQTKKGKIMNSKNNYIQLAIEHLEKIGKQLEKGMISQNDYNQQRLLILVDLKVNTINNYLEGK